MGIIISKKYIEQIIKEEIKASILEEGFKKTLSALGLAVFSALSPLKAKASERPEQVQQSFNVSDRYGIKYTKVGDSIFISEEALSKTTPEKVAKGVDVIPEIAIAVLRYNLQKHNLERMKNLSTRDRETILSDKDAKTSIIKSFNENVKFYVLSDSEFSGIGEEGTRAAYNFAGKAIYLRVSIFDSPFNIRSEYITDLSTNIAHEMQHAVDHIKSSIYGHHGVRDGRYTDPDNWPKLNPNVQSQDSDFEKYVGSHTEMSAYSYQLKQAFALTEKEDITVQDLIDGFSLYGIEVVKDPGSNMYTWTTPDAKNYGDADTVLNTSFLQTLINSTRPAYHGLLNPIINAIQPFTKKGITKTKDGKSIIFIDLESLKANLNKIAARQPTASRGITAESRENNVRRETTMEKTIRYRQRPTKSTR